MTLPADDFAAFADLRDLTGASDAQLAAMLARGCADLPSVNFEDAMSEALCRLFRHVTGIPWVRGWQEGLRPDAVTTVPDGQYGTVWLLSASPIGAPVTTHRDSLDAGGNLRDDKCEEVAQMMRYSWQLDVYRDAGQATRREENAAVQQPVGSALDVLVRLGIALDHYRVRQAAREYCMMRSALVRLSRISCSSSRSPRTASRTALHAPSSQSIAPRSACLAEKCSTALAARLWASSNT